MRPEILFPLFAPVTALPGVGPRFGKLIGKLAGDNVVSLCWHLPTGLIDRSLAPKVAEAPTGAIVTLTVVVDGHVAPGNSRQPYKVRCRPPSFANVAPMRDMLVGGMLADIVPTFDMINMIGGECDR